MKAGHTIELPPHGFVRYVDHLGSDTSIVESARVSFGEPSKGEEADKKLLHYLYKHRHTSPFEQPVIRFNIAMPIFVMRQFVRQRTFRLNEFSARYKELPDHFYTPDLWRTQSAANKQGSVDDQSIDQGYCNGIVESVYHAAYKAYEELIHAGVCREQARFVMPVATYTEIYVSCDIHNLLNFLRQRTDGHAQKEIRDVANAMQQIAEELFPWTFEAFKKYKMVVSEQ